MKNTQFKYKKLPYCPDCNSQDVIPLLQLQTTGHKEIYVPIIKLVCRNCNMENKIELTPENVEWANKVVRRSIMNTYIDIVKVNS